MLTEKVKLLQKVALLHEGKVLLLKRSAQEYSRPSCWDLPGGNSEWPTEITTSTVDLHKADIVREIFEETKLQTDPNNFSEKNLIFFRTFFQADKQIFSVICGWVLTATNQVTAFSPDQVILSDEHTEFAWVPLADLGQYDMGATGTFITTIIENAFHAKSIAETFSPHG
jgi:8-oxo-dGTP pyrophosphatase MutT (NUDIX family)